MMMTLFLFLLLAPQEGAVATSEPYATVATSSIFAEGGNAVDAAVAASFALAVTYPAAGNLGGGGFFLYRTPQGEAHFLDFRETAPAASHPDLYLDTSGKVNKSASRLGWRAVGIPGSVTGMAEAHRRWGRLPWKEVLAPAIWLAEDGYVLTKKSSQSLAWAAKYFAKDPMASSVFLDTHGTSWPAGHRLKQPELAATLRLIAEKGGDAFRRGPLVDGILKASRAGGGILTAEDFRDYRPEIRPVHHFHWQGLELLTLSPPSSGGVFLEQALTSLVHPKLTILGPMAGWTIQCIGEATALAFQDRNRWLGDPDGFDFAWTDLVAEDYLNHRRKFLSGDRFTPTSAPLNHPFLESEETTHFSVMDPQGGAVSVTTTLNGAYGAKVMAPGGFLMNNEMDDFAAAPGTANQFGLVQGKYNAVVAGRRPLSSMSPVIVVKEGRVDAVLGSPGGPTILTTVMQVLLNRYLFAMNPKAAMAFPRFHRQDLPEVLHFEPGRLNDFSRAYLKRVGQPMKRRSSLGDVNAIFWWKGEWRAFSDPRHEGLGL